jgi:DNA replication protein DnaC
MPELTQGDVLRKGEHIRRLECWSQSGVPRRHRSELESLKGVGWDEGQREAMDKLRPTLSAGGIAFLIGTVGTGKTLIGAEAVRWFTVYQGKTARYWRFADLLDHLRDRAYTDNESAGKILQGLARTPLLVIDELDKRRWSEDEAQWLLRLIDHRYGECTPTLLIANLSRDGLRQTLDPSVRDRLFEGGTVVELAGESKRRAAS